MKPLIAATLAAVLVSGTALAQQSNVTAAPPANPTGSNQYQGSGPTVGAAPGGSASPALGYQGPAATDEPRPMHRARRHHRRYHAAPAATDSSTVPTANPGSTK